MSKGDSDNEESSGASKPKNSNSAVIRANFAKIAPNGAAFVSQFYIFLFEEHPELEVLFKKVNQTLLEAKLLAALSLVVENIDNKDTLRSTLMELGKRHKGYGATASNYGAVGGALLKTLEVFLREDWNSDSKAAYTAFNGSKLNGSNFAHALLNFTKFCDCNLNDANFEGATLTCADFKDAMLCSANLQGAQLMGVNFTGALLSGANLKGANVDIEQLRRNAILKKTILPDGTISD